MNPVFLKRRIRPVIVHKQARLWVGRTSKSQMLFTKGNGAYLRRPCVHRIFESSGSKAHSRLLSPQQSLV
jgi:hypothetical protein